MTERESRNWFTIMRNSESWCHLVTWLNLGHMYSILCKILDKSVPCLLSDNDFDPFHKVIWNLLNTE